MFLVVGRRVYKCKTKLGLRRFLRWEGLSVNEKKKIGLHVKFFIIIRGDNIGRTNKFGQEQISRNPIAPLVIWFIFTHTLRKTLKRLTWKSD